MVKQSGPTISDEPAAHSMPRSSQRKLRVAVSVILIAVVFLFVGRSLNRNFRDIDWKAIKISQVGLGMALACLCCQRLFTGLICNTLLTSFGCGIGCQRSLGIIWSAAMGRYVPMKMAAIMGAALLLVRAGVRLPIALATLFLSTALTILIALIMAAPMLALPAVRTELPWAWIPAAAIVIGGLACLHPQAFVALCNGVLRLLRRPPLPSGMALRPFLAAVAFIAMRCLFLGMAVWLTTRAFMPIALDRFPIILGAALLASVGGFLAVFVPAGLGVQEWVYLLTLRSVLGPNVALLAVVFRLLQVATDAITGVTGLLLLKHSHIEAVNSLQG
jgi:glycosyltransferase 2 family protein